MVDSCCHGWKRVLLPVCSPLPQLSHYEFLAPLSLQSTSSEDGEPHLFAGLSKPSEHLFMPRAKWSVGGRRGSLLKPGHSVMTSAKKKKAFQALGRKVLLGWSGRDEPNPKEGSVSVWGLSGAWSSASKGACVLASLAPGVVQKCSAVALGPETFCWPSSSLGFCSVLRPSCCGCLQWGGGGGACPPPRRMATICRTPWPTAAPPVLIARGHGGPPLGERLSPQAAAAASGPLPVQEPLRQVTSLRLPWLGGGCAGKWREPFLGASCKSSLQHRGAD